LVVAGGPAAEFAWEEFLFGRIRNEHTRRAYGRAVGRFLAWCQGRGLDLPRIAPRDVGVYLDLLPGSTPTKKLHLAALRHFFDQLVTRHAVILNPAASVRAQRYQVVGLRDRAIIGILVYTAARVWAVAKLRMRDYFDAGDQYCLRFAEKGGKSREIPVRHDLRQFLSSYVASAGISDSAPEAPLFRSAIRRTGRLTDSGMTADDMSRMVKRRMRKAGLPSRLSPHSFRVATITDLLAQGVPLEDVQHLAGHADPRTTRLHDRRQRRVTRNIVERISI
jgi:site-specific recombinase XerD